MNKEIKRQIISDIGEKRFEHSLRVRDVAVELSKIYKLDRDKAEIAALYHDCAKIRDNETLLKRAQDYKLNLDEYMRENHELIHGPLGSRMAKDRYNITDPQILKAIKYHTIGKRDMNMLEKIIYIADYIEPERNFPGVEIVRETAYKDIDQALIMAMNNTIVFLIGIDKLIHPETVIARNKLIVKRR